MKASATYLTSALIALAMLLPAGTRADDNIPGIRVVGHVAVVSQVPGNLVSPSAPSTSTTPPWGDTASGMLIAPGARFAPPSPAQPGTMPFVRSDPHGVAPFPIVLNHTVRQYVDEILAHPSGFVESFERSRPFFVDMVRVLQQDGLPRDLVYLSFAESGFESSGAGPWQLSKSTARRFGLIVNKYVDERRDPIKSTRAAAEYLATLHDETADWHVALIGWNKGEAVLDRFLSLRGVEYDRLVTQLPRTTRGLMNRFMAVAVIAHHAREYGLQAVTFVEPPTYRTVRVGPGTMLTELAERYGTTIAQLRTLNPALLRDRTPKRIAFDVRVPNQPRTRL
jgi:membrane-bound lytic murein transglycosylase D